MTSDWKMHSISSDFIWKYTIATLPIAQHSKYWCWSPKTQRVLSHMRKQAFMCIHVITHYSVRLSVFCWYWSLIQELQLVSGTMTFTVNIHSSFYNIEILLNGSAVLVRVCAVPTVATEYCLKYLFKLTF